MKRFGIFLCIMLLLMTSGCGQNPEVQLEDEGPVWVITELVSYDADGNAENRATYEYDDNAGNYRQNNYNAAGELIAYMLVTQSEDGREVVHTNYSPDGTELSVVTKIMREGDKPLVEIDASTTYKYALYTTWEWNKAGTKADIFLALAENAEPNKIGTIEYDNQNRVIRETNGNLETTYIYEEQKNTIWSDLADGSRYAIVRYYDEQNRLTEVYDYRVQHDGDYTDDDLVNYTKQTYKEDGHSMTVEYWTKDLATGDRLSGTSEITYQPLEDVV